jgi:hypothetical protein
MRYQIRAAVAAVLFVCAQEAFSADLVGTVRNGAEPRAGVTVLLRGTSETTEGQERLTTTTGTGEFAFSGIPPGMYELMCDGYQPVSVQVGAGINRRDCP